MIEKTVYCLILQRRKIIKFYSRENSSDRQALQKSFLEAIEQDHILAESLKLNQFVFQKMDDYIKDWCDIELFDEISDRCEIRVLLIQDFNKLQIGESIDVTIVNDNPGLELASTSGLPQTDSIPILNVKDSNEQIEQVEKEDDISSKDDQVQHQKKKIKLETSTKNCLPQTNVSQLKTLPPLSIEIETFINMKGVDAAQPKIINFYGHYLWQKTNGQPTKNDYAIFASTIVGSFPALKGGNDDCGIVRNSLSVWIRNRRSTLKKEGIIINKNYNAKNVVQSFPALRVNEDNSNVKVKKITEADIEKSNDEIKKYVAGKNKEHYKRLLKISKSIRREYIENEAGSIEDIIQEYKILLDFDMIVFECCEIILELNIPILLEESKKVLNELRYYYRNNNKVSNKWALLAEVSQDLMPKKYKNGKSDALFLVNEMMAKLECLKSQKNAAPRVVIFYCEESEDVQIFIVASEDLQIEVNNPTPEKVVLGLLSTYYAWHQKFPDAYKQTLEFLSHKLFKTDINKNSAVGKYIRKVENDNLTRKSSDDEKEN